jgi:hypothetical protein
LTALTVFNVLDKMPSEVEKNLPATNEGYGTQEYWCAAISNKKRG